jgi:hypothetical protein
MGKFTPRPPRGDKKYQRFHLGGGNMKRGREKDENVKEKERKGKGKEENGKKKENEK